MPKAPNEKAVEAERLYRTGMKLVEIGQKLGVPAGTVRRWKSAYCWDNGRSDKKANVRKEANVRIVPEPEVISVMENPALTNQQRLFCLHYAKSFNATRSYQKAYGCSYAVANAEGPTLLVNPSIREEIGRLKALRYGRALLEPGDVFQKYMDIAFADMTDYVSFGQEEEQVINMLGPVMVQEPETGERIPMLRRVNVVRACESGEVDGTVISEVAQSKDGFRIKLADRMKALAWLADHMDLATEEQRARVENLRAATAKLHGDVPEGEPENDGLLEALRGEAGEVWQK